MTPSMYGEEEGPDCMVEDYVQPTLGTAMVEWVIPSNPSVRLVGQCYWEPLLD